MRESWDVVRHASPEQVAFYEGNGYLPFGRVFTHEEMEALREHVDARIAALPAGERPEGMDRPHFDDPWLFRYLAHPRVLDVIEDFLGPDIVLWSSHFISKPRGDGRAVPWHTDGAYWRDRLKPMKVITLWLAVDPSTAENGCMKVIAGSHRALRDSMANYGAVDRESNVFDAELRPEFVDTSKEVTLELAVGECHFHDAWTVHGSSPNVSEQRRCGYTMRYMPATVRHDAGADPGHRIYLLRGQDRSGGHNRYESVPDV